MHCNDEVKTCKDEKKIKNFKFELTQYKYFIKNHVRKNQQFIR